MGGEGDIGAALVDREAGFIVPWLADEDEAHEGDEELEDGGLGGVPGFVGAFGVPGSEERKADVAWIYVSPECARCGGGSDISYHLRRGWG